MAAILLRNEFYKDGIKRVNTLQAHFSGASSFMINIQNGKIRNSKDKKFGIIRIDKDQAKELANWINECLA